MTSSISETRKTYASLVSESFARRGRVIDVANVHCNGTTFRRYNVNAGVVAVEARSDHYLSNGDLGLYVKNVHYHSAAGNISPPIFCFQDDSISPGAFEIHRVTGLSHFSDNGAYGYAVFSKSRDKHLKLVRFYDWFILEYVFPSIKLCRELYEAKVRLYVFHQNTSDIHQ